MSLVPPYQASIEFVQGGQAISGSLQAVVLAGGMPISQTIVSVDGFGLTPNVDQYDLIVVTAQAMPLLINNPITLLVVPNGSKLMLRIRDDGTSRAITYGTKYRGLVATLPSSTTAGKTKYLGFVYNSNDDFWDLLAVANQQ